MFIVILAIFAMSSSKKKHIKVLLEKSQLLKSASLNLPVLKNQNRFQHTAF